MTQKEFAVRLGVSNSRVSNWEQGVNRPDADLLASICQTLSISADELLDIHLPGDETAQGERCASVSGIEMHIIKKYRLLDQRGQQAVLDTVDRELKYSSSENPLPLQLIARTGGAVSLFVDDDAIDAALEALDRSAPDADEENELL